MVDPGGPSCFANECETVVNSIKHCTIIIYFAYNAISKGKNVYYW